MKVPQLDFWNGTSLVLNLIFGISTIIFSVIAIKQARKKKILAYAILSDTPIVSILKEMEKKIYVNYGLIKVVQIRIIEILLKNSGTEVIDEKDFHNPLTFCNLTIPKDGKPQVFWDRISIQPEDINTELKVFDNKLGLKPFMINPGERIFVKFLIAELYEDIDTKIKVEARIAGTKLIEESSFYDDKPSDIILRLQFIIVTMTISIIILLLIIFLFLYLYKNPEILFIGILFLIVMNFVFIKFPNLFIKEVEQL